MFDQIKNWPFLNEPLYRWVIFLFAMIIILMTWGTVIAYMKD